jgi:two-component system, LuxR family, response regulator FixJ
VLEPTVFVVDDDPAMRASLRWLLESVGLRVSTFATAREFLATYQPPHPGCLVLDVRMPGMSGLDLQAELIARQIRIPVLIITGYAEVPIAVRAMKAGAFDFIEKPFSDQTLLDRIRRAISIDREARRHSEWRDEIRRRYDQLTIREREVMKLVVRGRSNKWIASDLRLSTKTIEAHRSHVMHKMGADSLAELIRLSLALENPETE